MKLFFQKSVCVALLGLLGLGPAVAQTTRPFPHPDRIRYDSHCLTIDGRDVFIYSGAFHYFRCPRELWRDRFQKIKDAGFNTVETYVPWNWSEQQMPAGTNDFSRIELQDLDDWLAMARESGFYIIVRPGPYICAEWATGGFPRWLLAKKPDHPLRAESWLRSDDPLFLAWSRHWYDAVCPVIARHQITRLAPGKPGVILVQIENEYDYGPRLSDESKAGQLRALAQFARADGIDVPLIACWTRQVRGSTDPVLREIFDCDNFYPRWSVDGIQDDMTRLQRDQPDAPLGVTELQGGWFSQVGGKLSEDQDGLTDAQINNLTLFAIQNGGTLLNYYMLVGGTNPDDWAARDLTATYDYNAPIREWGGVGGRYQRVKAIGQMLGEHGAELARSEAVDCETTATQTDVKVVVRRAANGARFLFVRTSRHDASRAGTATVKEKSGVSFVFDYQLEPFGSKILYLPPGATSAARGEWLPKDAPVPARPQNLPSPVVLSSARMRADPGPRRWTQLHPGETPAQAGVYDSRWIIYRAKLTVPSATNLLVEYPEGDAVSTTVNGQPAASVSHNGGNAIFELPAGADQIELLHENHGFANSGNNLERQAGVTARLINSRLCAGQPVSGWRMRLVKEAGQLPEVEPGFDDTDWTPVAADNENATQLTPNQTGVFRAGLDLAAAELAGAKIILTFVRIDDSGWVYVNGKCVGTADDWSRAHAFDITKHLHAGHNVIAVVVHNEGGGGGIGLPTLAASLEGGAVPLESCGQPAGDDGQWWRPAFDDRDWEQTAIGAASAPAVDPPLTWYRMNFALPSPRPGVWVPWRLHLAASGNGFLHLNGHALGRYWEAGPQHDFFLPECWLNFGGGTNNLTLNLRSTERGAAIQSATVEPFAESAGKR